MMESEMEWTVRQYSKEWERERLATVALRTGEGFIVKPGYADAQGRKVWVCEPFIMAPEDHGVYGGDVCWSIAYRNDRQGLQLYFSEKDLRFDGLEVRTNLAISP